MPQNLAHSITVITGASSGIGRATALKLAAEGGTVVLASRRAQELERLAAEVATACGKSMVCPVDVTDESAVRRLVETVIDAYGRIDVWVNNASVMSFGQFLDTPSDDVRRIFDVNVLGYLNGIRAVLPHFLEQGSGTIVNVASLDSRVPQPESLPYVASKHAVRSVGMSIRQELMLRGADDVHVVTVLPAAIDTPLFGHAANYSGTDIRPPRPLYPADTVAKAIVDGIRTPRNELIAGGTGWLAHLAMKISPALTERMMTLMAWEQTRQGTPSAPTSGNLYEPSKGDARISGGMLTQKDLQRRSLVRKGLVATGLGVGAGLIGRQLRKSLLAD